MSWERAYLAAAVILGSSVDAALAALDGPAAQRAEEMSTGLRDPNKVARAAALADLARPIAVAVERASLA